MFEMQAMCVSYAFFALCLLGHLITQGDTPERYQVSEVSQHVKHCVLASKWPDSCAIYAQRVRNVLGMQESRKTLQPQSQSYFKD
eukprot:3341172-Amphidinium_carterae.1